MKNLSALYLLCLGVLVALVIMFYYQWLRRKLNDHSLLTQYDAFFAHNPNPMLIFCEEQGSFLYINKKAESFYGYSKPEFDLMTVNDICLPPEHTFSGSSLHKLKANNEKGTTWKHITKAGQQQYVQIYTYPLLYKKKKARIAIVHDITALKEQEALLQWQHTYIREIVYTTSHIVRAPLANIMLLTEVLSHDALPEEEHNRMLQLISDSSMQLDIAIRDLIEKLRMN